VTASENCLDRYFLESSRSQIDRVRRVGSTN